MRGKHSNVDKDPTFFNKHDNSNNKQIRPHIRLLLHITLKVTSVERRKLAEKHVLNRNKENWVSIVERPGLNHEKNIGLNSPFMAVAEVLMQSSASLLFYQLDELFTSLLSNK